jgi:hypothetical protein
MDQLTYVGLWQLADLFCAHYDAYVKDSRAHIPQPITPELLERAYREKWAVSGYTARQDGDKMVTHIGAIDFDHSSRHEEKSVRATLQKLGIPTLRSASRRGSHLWITTHEEGPASVMHKALEQAIRLTDANILSECEVFPKVSTAQWGVGALRLPLMTHPKTRQRYPAYDMDGNRLTKLIDVVLSVQSTDWKVLRSLAADAPVEYPRNLGAYRQRREYTDVGSATDLLDKLGVQATPGHSCRCPFHEDRHASMSVAQDDERVWCKAPECEAYNGGRGVGTLALAKMVQR